MPFSDVVTRPQSAPLMPDRVNVSLLGKAEKKPPMKPSGVKPTHDFNARMRARVGRGSK